MAMIRGITVSHEKRTADCVAVRVPAPHSVTIPISMHIGAPAKCIVSEGDKVAVGQIIAESGGFVSAPIHASVSGTVKKLTEILTVSGTSTPAVVIESDGLMTRSPDAVPPAVTDRESFLAAVRASGAVGLGGAGFPTAVKLDVKAPAKIECVIINGAECEPYITSDTRTMEDHADAIGRGCALLEKFLAVEKIILAVEDNKPLAIRKMREVAEKDKCVSLSVLRAQYPQGGEKVLIYNTVRRIVPEGKLPIDVGVVVLNCTTLAFLADYMETGMPLVEKCITFDGTAVSKPQNVIVPIGTSIADVAEFCGGWKCEPKKILLGGPMMGVAVFDQNFPILKNTNAILSFSEDGTVKETACIRCGACLNRCPLRLDPRAISHALKLGDGERLAALKANLCMECGCCSYVCPAKKPLVQSNKLAKSFLREYLSRRKAAEEAKA